ncbi:DUF6230 family protein [Nocardioides limicola]|uniref:DUF6230 family protein n=1 Tax=Nocardioides limicola TaxID=2803368 RepID=UPI00193BFBCF|nr:DUF6230 family protein [Nocardioides sp. DJM-14]
MTAAPIRRARTRWRRALLVSLPAVVASLALGLTLAHGNSLTQLVVQGTKVDLAVAGLFAREAGLGVVTVQRNDCDVDGNNCTLRSEKVFRLGLADGRINQLCLAAPQTLRLGGVAQSYTVLLTAGDSGADRLATWDITAKNMVIDLTQAQVGGFELDGNVHINTTAEGVTTIVDEQGNPVVNPLAADAGAHRFGIQASYAKLKDVRQASGYVIVVEDLLRLDDLHIEVRSGTVSCPSQGTATSWPLAPIKGAGRCMDVSGGNLADGTAVVVWNCNNQVNQDFYVETSTKLSMLGTKCLTADGTTAGSPVRSRTCDSGLDARQKWTYDADLTQTQIRNTASGLCIEGSTTNGTGLTLRACDAGKTVQRWDLPR